MPASLRFLLAALLGLLLTGAARAADPSDLFSEGQRLETRGLLEEAAGCYVRALQAKPSDSACARRLTRLFDRLPPSRLPLAAPDVLPMPSERMDTRLSSSGPAEQSFWTTGPLFPDEGRKADPVHGWRVNRVQYGYVLNRAEKHWELRFLLLFASPQLSESSADHAPLAAEVRRALSHLYWLAKANLDREPRFESRRFAQVWLCEKGAGGGETIGGDIYLYQILTPRAPQEWWRELAHEYGHLVLPGVGGFDPPDPWANGEMGELLFTRWLLQSPGSSGLTWTGSLSKDEFERLQVKPRLDLFRREGATSPLARGTSRLAVDYLLGALAATEDDLGRDGLKQLFLQYRGTRTPDLLAAASALRKKAGPQPR